MSEFNTSAMAWQGRTKTRRVMAPARAIVLGIFFKLCMGLAMIGWSGATGVAAAQSTSAIIVEGNHRVEADTIRSYFRLGHGGRLEEREADAALKALYATGLFSDVNIKHAGDHILVKVVEAPLIDKIAFEGNKAIKEKQLTDVLQSKSRGPFSRATVQSDVERMVELYHAAGHYDVRIEPQTIARHDNQLDLVFKIAEGEKTGVKKVVFVGNHAFADQKLQDAIKTKQWNLLSWLNNNDVYDRDRVELDRDLLRRFYLKNGYADVRVTSAAAVFDPNSKGFVITFTIDEGQPYRLSTVDIRSEVPAVAADPLRGFIRTNAGAVYNADAVQQTVEDVTKEIAKRGYPFATVQPRADRNVAQHTIALTYSIENGARIYVERINVRGNTRTRDNVIRRELDITEGDAYNRVLFDKAEKRIKNLGLFKSVKITNEPGSAPDKIVVNITVEEQQTGDFNVSGGYSTTDGPLGEITVSERNLFGAGIFAKGTVDFGEYARGFTLGLTDPYFLGNRLAVGFDLYDKENLVSPTQSYGSNTYGATFRVGVPVTDEVSTQLHYSIFNQDVTLAPGLIGCSPANPPAGGCPSLPVQQAALTGPQWISMIGYTVAYNTLDSNTNPTSGVRAAVNQDYAGLGGDAQFLKTTGDIRAYQPITNDIVGVAHVQDGYVTGFGGQQVPLLDTFFGGPNLVRGFALNGFGPRDLTPGTTQDNVGGDAYWATSAELQAPVPYLPSDYGLKVAVFADAGNVWGYGGPTSVGGQSISLPSSSLIRSSLGASLIWSSPLGPLRLDYAVPVTKEPYDIVQPFRFSAGPF